MMTKRILVAIAIAGLPFSALNARLCASSLAGAGWTVGNWPRGETIRFSAAPSLQEHAYAVQISRDSPASEAVVHLVKFGDWSCDRRDREQEWTFPLSAAEASLFFDSIGDLEPRLRPDQGIVLDGTLFKYEHRRNGVVRRFPVSPTAMGESGRLSALILSLMMVARGAIPDSPDWSEYSEARGPLR